MYKVTFQPLDLVYDAPEGISLLEAQIRAGLKPDAPCGGGGTCGKCIVGLVGPDGAVREVKACQTPVTEDMTVILPQAGKNSILVQGLSRAFALDPPVTSGVLTVPRGSIQDPSAEWDRLTRAVADTFGVALAPDVALASQAPGLLKQFDYSPQAVLYDGELLALRAPGRLCAAAVDIGTTTVVLHILDAQTGEILSSQSALNPQTEFGADVIMRMNYAIENGVAPLSSAIRACVNDLLREGAQQAGVSLEDVFSIVIAGNTCMHHLFLGVDPTPLALSPYYPAIRQELVLKAADYDLAIHPRGKLFVLPCIAGFVGADTSAVMLACEMDEEEVLTLAIDIGTNGELVLGDKNGLLCCSTAAGPAFEGAKITCGMRGAVGAIDHISLTDTGLTYSVIGDEKPVGLCGSGLMDLTALLLEVGLVDETGRIVDEDEVDTPLARALYPRVGEADGLKTFTLASAAESGNGRPVYLTQKDIREVQLAKGAMAAGVTLMLQKPGKKTSDIQKVYIAGAFGNYMDPKSACRIGLIPAELADRITPVGNAASEGAKIAALSHTEFVRAQAISEKAGFIELAASPAFQDVFVDELTFPERD